MRNLTDSEVLTLQAAGCSAEHWHSVYIAENLDVSNIEHCRFEGRVEIEEGVTLRGSTIGNYHICQGAKVIDTLRLETRHNSTFGNGVKVAAVNENGGRSVAIYNNLTAQVAYIVAMYRHRKVVVEGILNQIDDFAAAVRSDMGFVGRNSTILGARFIREVNIGEGVTIEGASLLENGTLLTGAYVGVDVKAKDFIAVENSKIDCGTTLERVFVGEDVVVSKGFTAVDSLLFASSHLENGEACSIFAGPYTVSHHKSSLLIAGIFSFFNAGSGTNQSNHLFKSGAIHQAVHRRGTKFASGGYVMAPAAEGEFTTVIGRHTKHHDTSLLPYSYLIENGGISYLLPAFALRSYGTVRDIEKWQKRDKRAVCRDIINYNQYNPLLAGKVAGAIEILNALLAENPDAELLHYNNTVIKRPIAERGVALYNLYLTAALGAMARCGNGSATTASQWVDVAGQYIDKSVLDAILDSFTDINALNSALSDFNSQYENAARGWALAYMGKEPSAEDIAAAEAAQEALQRITDADRTADTSPAMSVGYGIDSTEIDEILADFNTVQKK